MKNNIINLTISLGILNRHVELQDSFLVRKDGNLSFKYPCKSLWAVSVVPIDFLICLGLLLFFYTLNVTRSNFDNKLVVLISPPSKVLSDIIETKHVLIQPRLCL